jgi:hypothetical protein
MKMELKKKLAFIASAAFGISFFLPALSDESGYSCFIDCWRVFTRSDSYHTFPIGGWVYYSGFVAANALFVALAGAIFCPAPFSKARLWISLASLLQVLSWLVVNLTNIDKKDPFALGIGYFLWLVSYTVLFGAHCAQVLQPNQLPDPTSPSVTPPAGAGGTPSVAADH